MRNIHRRPTAESSTTHHEESFGDRNHGHRQNPGALRLEQKNLRTCKQTFAGALRMCKEGFAGALRMCLEGLAKHRIATILMVVIICILFLCGLWAFHGYGLDKKTGRAMGDDQYTTTTTTVHSSSTVYITHYVHYAQFHGARPVHHQEPMAVPLNLKATGQVIRQELSHLVTTTSAPVSGLYFVPVTNEGWPRLEQDSRPSSRSASNTDGSQNLQESPSLGNTEPEAKPPFQPREMDPPRNLFASQAAADTSSFPRWGVELLYDLHHRSRRSIPFYKQWCIQNACSPQRQLSSICNTSINSRFQKQECHWCWPENQMKHQEIDKHCSEVSKRTLNAIFITCGICLFCMLFVASLLATRELRHRRRAKLDPTLHTHTIRTSPLKDKPNSVLSHWFSHGMSKFGGSSKAAKSRVDEDPATRKRSPGETVGLTPWYNPHFAKSGKRSGIDPETPAPNQLRHQKQESKSFDQAVAIGDGDPRERVPVLPPAPPAISSRVFSDIKNMGQGRLLSGPGTNDCQHDPQATPRRFPRQSRAVSSGSEQRSSGAMHRGDIGAGQYNLQRLTERS